MSAVAAPEKGSGRRSRAGRMVAGFAVGLVVVAVAVVTVLSDRSSSGGDRGGGERVGGARQAAAVKTAPTEPLPAAARYRHVFDRDYVGPVWITVDAPDAGTRSVTIKWGPWQRRITHQGAEPVTYHFWKGITSGIEDVPPTTVVVDPGAEVVFGAGEIPQGAIDVNKDWEPAA